jgi:pimeloyl-ACP methyl ester carboxylesterase
MRILSRLILFLAVIYLGICLVLFICQRSMIYHPLPSAIDDPESITTLKTSDADLLVSSRPIKSQKAIIYFGGNGEDVSRNLSVFAEKFPDYALYFLHYRGYGGSEGSPSEKAFASDALELFDRVHVEHPDVVLIGRSLGSGVAIHLASQRPASRLILITPYDSIEAIAEQQYPYFPVRLLLKDKFESWRYAPKISIPTLLIKAEDDEVIPAINTDRLYASFNKGVAKLKVIANVGHNSIARSLDYFRVIESGM